MTLRLGLTRKTIQELHVGFEKGTIQSDAYTVYELLTNGNKKLKRVLCWAHVRNRFESAFLSAKDKIADWFVKKIAELYRIENITHVVKEIINGNTNYETLVPWAIKLA